MNAVTEFQHYRSIWISDVHLGTRGSKADFLLDFLKYTESDHLYLVGDIVDGWRLKRSWYWPQAHNDVVQKILRKARKGTRVVFIPGNHDEVLRDYCGIVFGEVEVVDELVHETADGRRFLLIHGDQFDQVMRHHRWVAVLGDKAYELLVRINTLLSWGRRKLGISGYWSLAGYAKRKVKTALTFIFDFETSAIHHARERGLDGVICGHIHWATIREIDGLTYVNCGDWVDSCTAIVEHFDGRLELVTWGEQKPVAMLAAPVAETVEA